MPAHHLGDLFANGIGRVQARHRLLEDKADGVAADAVELPGRQAEQFLPVELARCRQPRGRLSACTSPTAACTVTLLPEPDSPTTQTTSLCPTLNDTWSTTVSQP